MLLGDLEKTTKPEEINKCHLVQISTHSCLQTIHSQDHLAPEPSSWLVVPAIQELEMNPPCSWDFVQPSSLQPTLFLRKILKFKVPTHALGLACIMRATRPQDEAWWTQE